MRMMRRQLSRNPGLQFCHMCELAQVRHVAFPRRDLATMHYGRPRARMDRARWTRPSGPSLQLLTKATSTRLHDRDTTRHSGFGHACFERNPAVNAEGVRTLGDLVEKLEKDTRLFLAQQRLPTEETTLVALRACALVGAKLIHEAAKQAEETAGNLSATTATHLLSLASWQRSPELSSQEAMVSVSQAAQSIMAHPNVCITPQLLETYIGIQAGLGKPETLPRVLGLYASKPKARTVSGSICYVERNPDKAESAVPPAMADAALDSAIKAKHLDAAVAIIEFTYGAKSFVRSKLLKNALLPGLISVSLPVAAYLFSSRVSGFQESMDPALMTSIVFAGIMAYSVLIASLAMVTVTTANDHMRRVSWVPGMPLRERWLREEERAALDKLALAFGFSDQRRHGEEEGNEFELLREHCLHRGMLVDAVELMEGMS